MGLLAGIYEVRLFSLQVCESFVLFLDHAVMELKYADVISDTYYGMDQGSDFCLGVNEKCQQMTCFLLAELNLANAASTRGAKVKNTDGNINGYFRDIAI